MAARKSLGRGLEDRTDSSAIPARVRRSDRGGAHHGLNQQFPYAPSSLRTHRIPERRRLLGLVPGWPNSNDRSGLVGLGKASDWKIKR